MAFSRRHLIRFVLLIGLSCVATLAQDRIVSPARFRTIALGQPLPDLFYEIRGKSTPLSLGGGALSRWQDAPPGGTLSFYREEPASEPGKPPVRVTVAAVRFGSGSSHLVVLLSLINPAQPDAPPEVSALAIDDSFSQHPLGTVRAFNFSRRGAALKLDTAVAELQPGESKVVRYPADQSTLWFKVALREEAGWVLRGGSAIALIPGTRSLLVISDSQPASDDPRPTSVDVRNIIDTYQPPEVSAVASR